MAARLAQNYTSYTINHASGVSYKHDSFPQLLPVAVVSLSPALASDLRTVTVGCFGAGGGGIAMW